MAASADTTCDSFFLSESENLSSKGSSKATEKSFTPFQRNGYGNSRNRFRGSSNSNRGKFRSQYGKPSSGSNAVPLTKPRPSFTLSEENGSPDDKISTPRDRFFSSSTAKFSRRGNAGSFPRKNDRFFSNKESPNDDSNFITSAPRRDESNIGQFESGKHKYFDDSNQDAENSISTSTNTSENKQKLKLDAALIKKNKKRKRDVRNENTDVINDMETDLTIENGTLEKQKNRKPDAKKGKKWKRAFENEITDVFNSQESELNEESSRPLSENKQDLVCDSTHGKQNKKFKRSVENGKTNVRSCEDTNTSLENNILENPNQGKRQKRENFFKTKGNKANDASFQNSLKSKGQEKINKKHNPNQSQPPDRMTSFQKAMLEYQTQQNMKEVKKKELAGKKEEQKKALERYKKKKREKSIKLSKKTKKGQPVMKERIELLLEKIQKNIASEEKGS